MGLIACPSCQRHIREEDVCPFCKAPRAGALAAALFVAGCSTLAKDPEPPRGGSPTETGSTGSTGESGANGASGMTGDGGANRSGGNGGPMEMTDGGAGPSPPAIDGGAAPAPPPAPVDAGAAPADAARPDAPVHAKPQPRPRPDPPRDTVRPLYGIDRD